MRSRTDKTTHYTEDNQWQDPAQPLSSVLLGRHVAVHIRGSAKCWHRGCSTYIGSETKSLPTKPGAPKAKGGKTAEDVEAWLREQLVRRLVDGAEDTPSTAVDVDMDAP